MSDVNVLKFDVESAKCPPGSKAIHPEFGWCEVVAANGFERVVIYEMYPAGEETIRQVEATANVRDLREVDPRKDFFTRPAGSVSAIFRKTEKST